MLDTMQYSCYTVPRLTPCNTVAIQFHAVTPCNKVAIQFHAWHHAVQLLYSSMPWHHAIKLLYSSMPWHHAISFVWLRCELDDSANMIQFLAETRDFYVCSQNYNKQLFASSRPSFCTEKHGHLLNGFNDIWYSSFFQNLSRKFKFH